MTKQFEVGKVYYGVEVIDRLKFSRIVARFPDGTVREKKVMVWSDDVECLEADIGIRAD